MLIKDYDDARATMVSVAYAADEKPQQAAECALAVMTYASKATRVAPQKRYALWFEAQSAIEAIYLAVMFAPPSLRYTVTNIRGEGAKLTPPPK